MQSIPLSPPDIDNLREDVIGSVKQRASPPHHSFVTRFISDRFAIEADAANPIVIGQKPLAVCPAPSKNDRTSLMRERHRLNQQRYRRKQKKCQHDLESSIQQLRLEIDHLQRQQNEIGCPNMWVVATEYFRVFQYGIHAQKELRAMQLDFLRSMVAKDFDAGSVRDLAGLVTHWIIFSQYFQDANLELERLEKAGEDSLVATTVTKITLSRSALANAFPHLLVYSPRSEGLSIAAKLIDQTLFLHGSVNFHWDNSIKRVVRLYSHTDMVSPLLRLLGNLEDVALVLNDAFITPDGRASSPI